MYGKKIFSRWAKRIGLGYRANDLDDELQFHLEKEIEQNAASGMSLDEARRHALIALGGMQQTRESLRQVYLLHLWDVLLQDARYGLRMLRKSPAFTLSCVLILALGIGMNTAIFSMIDFVAFRTLTANDPQNLLLLRWHGHTEPQYHIYADHGDCISTSNKGSAGGCSFSIPFLHAAESQTGVFDAVSAFSLAPQIALSDNGPPTILNNAQVVSGNYFQTLGVQAAAGRTFGPADDTPSSPPTAMLSYGYWQTAFGGDAKVVGRTVRLNGIPFTIIGVAERGFESLSLGRRYDMWLPLALRPRLMPDWTPREDDEGAWWLVIIGRPKPGVSPKQAEAAVSLLFRNQTLHGSNPLFHEADDPGVSAVPAEQALRGGREKILQPLFVLLLAVGVILLIACANVAGLLLARATARRKEIAVRLTLGARRGRILSQLLIESLTLAFLGGFAGLFLAYWGDRGIVALINRVATEGPTLTPQLDVRVLAFTAVVSMFTGVVFGLLPAFRSLKFDLTPSLKAGATGSASENQHQRWYNLGNSLVIAQVALAVVALVVAGLLVHSLSSLRNADLGFEPRNILLFGLDPTVAGYKDQQADALYRELQEQFARLPGAASVSYSWRPLLSGGRMSMNFVSPGTSFENAAMDFMPVSQGFFKTMGIPIKAGRDFAPADFDLAVAALAASKAEDSKLVSVPVPTIVNETFVRRYFPNADPLGQRLETPVLRSGNATGAAKRPRSPGWQIVGVVRDAKYNQVRREVNPTAYVPQGGGAAFFELRTQGEPAQLTPVIRSVVSHKDSNLALFQVSTQMERIESSLLGDRLLAQLSSYFGLLALLLACTGLYGLLSYEVARRTREIGIRMAVGARQHNVIRMIVRQAVALALAGSLIGIVVSLVVARVLKSLLYGVTPGDPITLAGVVLLLLLVTLAACFLPARRATRVDPLVALRYE